jgi:hypothetical protein
MKNYQQLQKAIEERVNCLFPSALFEAMLKQHKKHGFKSSCRCDYCQKKRILSSNPGWSYRSDRYHGFLGYNGQTYWDLKKALKKVEEDDF